MNREAKQTPVADIKLERYALGELPEAEMAQVSRLLEEDAGLRARLDALEQSDREIRERYPASQMAGLVRARLWETRRRESVRSKARVQKLWPALASLAAAALVVLTVLPEGIFTEPEAGVPVATEEVVRIKGLEPQVQLFRRTEDGSERLADGARARAGDLIRVAYQAAGRPYGVIVSLDGRGAVTLHLPQEGEQAARLGDGGSVLLDFAYELDDAPRWERFYFVTGETDFAIAPVLEALGRVGTGSPIGAPDALALPEGLEQFIISLDKGTTR
jgi:hypothetical protein